MSEKQDVLSKHELRALRLIVQALVELMSDDDTSAVSAKPAKKKASKKAPQSLRLVPKNAS
jgi:hypothetical protein